MSRIKINNIRCYANHGCLPHEAVIGGHYRIDITLEADLSQATQTDDLMHTVDYCDVQRIVSREMMQRSKLIEHVAKRIGDKLMSSLPKIQYTCVALTKLAPPMGGDVESVTVEMEFYR